MGKGLDARLQALERQCGAEDNTPVLILRLYGDNSEPGRELLEEARRRAKRQGLAFGTVCKGESGDWEIWDRE